MPIDYSRWDAVVNKGRTQVEEEERETDEEERDWSQMTEEERRAHAQDAELKERKLMNDRRHHEANMRQEYDAIAARMDRDLACVDDSWMQGVDLDSYEDFTIKRTWRVVKPRGTDFFKAGNYAKAEQQWLGGIELVNRVGMSWPTASQLYVQLKCNLAQLYLKQKNWEQARHMTTSALEVDPRCQKALYRRALVRIHYAEWFDAKRDLERVLRGFPNNQEAKTKLGEVNDALRGKAEQLKGGGVKIASGIEELTPGGTLRKLSVLVRGEDQPADQRWTWPWGLSSYLAESDDRPVLTVHVVVRTVGGEELFTTRSRAVLPRTPEEQNMLRVTMQKIAQRDDEAGKAPRTPQDFCVTETLKPMRWRYGDPTVYAGFELAARSMRLREKALFEIDQPLLEPSVRDFYRADGGVARVAGLPDFKHHIEERKLKLLEEELHEWELDLENKTQRTVHAELELLELTMYRDVTLQRDGKNLVHIAYAGRPGGQVLERGMRIVGSFVVAGALNGKALYHVEDTTWRLGGEGGESDPDVWGKSAFVPRCVGQAIADADWEELREGARVEARLEAGPSPLQLNPRLAAGYDWKRAMDHHPPVALTVDIKHIAPQMPEPTGPHG